MRKLTVSLVQISAGIDLGRNMATLDRLLARTPRSEVLVLPEVFSVRGGHEDYAKVAQPIPGRDTDRLAEIAVTRRSWVVACLIEREGRRLFNTCAVVNRSGKLVATYRKIHLFEAFLGNGQVIRENDTYGAGTQPVFVDIEGWRCGLSICYDVRFPELYRYYASEGASVLFVPSNFTQRTGKDHWEVLLRARAIENQCYVVAPNQSGSNGRTGVVSYGHSMVVGPWGEVVADMRGGQGVLKAELDPAEVDRVRARVPALRHRKL